MSKLIFEARTLNGPTKRIALSATSSLRVLLETAMGPSKFNNYNLTKVFVKGTRQWIEVDDLQDLQHNDQLLFLTNEQNPPTEDEIGEELPVWETLRNLLLKKDPALKVDKHVIDRMIKRFSPRLPPILIQKDQELALELYETTLSLPQTHTEMELTIEGYYLDGNLILNNENLVICFKGTKPCLLKTLTEKEAYRMKALIPHLQIDGKPLSPHIVEMEIVSVRKKNFAIMPLMPTSLEQLLVINSSDAERLYFQMKSALQALHRQQFAHMDVKPANICINSAGDFVLIDFGSVARFGEVTQSTVTYIPHGLDPKYSRAAVDWWMLAATVTERACKCDRWGLGLKNPTKQETIEMLQSIPRVVTDFMSLVQEL